MITSKTKGRNTKRWRWWLAATLVILGLPLGGLAAVMLLEGRAPAPELAAYFSRPPPGTIDVTAHLDSLIVDGRLDATAVDRAFRTVRGRLDGVEMVVVPSYLADQFMAGRSLGVIDYFSDQEAWLRSQGIRTTIAPVDTEASVADNGRLLAALIADSDRPLCLITHSKGGLDTLEALLSIDRSLLARVRCWLAFQAPFSGSPLADMAAGLRTARPAFDGALTLLGGSATSLDDLTTPVRRDRLRQTDEAIREILARVPMLSVATVLDQSDRLIPSSRFEAPRRWMAEHGIASDGAVPVNAAILPHSRYVVVEGLDHTDTVDGDTALAAMGANDATFLQALLVVALSAAAHE